MEHSNVNNLENKSTTENVTETGRNLKNDKKDKRVQIQISENDEKIIEKNINKKKNVNIADNKIIEINLNEELPPSFYDEYEICPNLSEKFKVEEVKKLINKILIENLKDKSYSYESAKILTKKISEDVNQSIRKLNMRRYKHAVQVIVGQELGAGCHYIAKCKWDVECDTYVSDVFTNSTLFCVCTVFGIYLY